MKTQDSKTFKVGWITYVEKLAYELDCSYISSTVSIKF